MSTLVVHYDSLNNAAIRAKNIEIYCRDYADDIYKNVREVLNEYQGEHSSYIKNALEWETRKRGNLAGIASKFSTYEMNLRAIRGKCESTDNRVKGKIQSLSASFEARNDIHVTSLEYWVRYSRNARGNRLVNDLKDEMRYIGENIQQSIEEWYDYKGGEELLGAIVGSFVKVAAATLAVMAATNPFSIVIGLAVFVFAFANGAFDMTNAVVAYAEEQNRDPANAKRLNDVDTMADHLLYHSDDENMHKLAGFLKVAEFIVTTLDFAKNMLNFVTKGAEIMSKIGRIDKNFALGITDLFKNGDFAEWLGFDIESLIKNLFSGIGSTFKDGLNIENIIKNIIENIPVIEVGADIVDTGKDFVDLIN